MESTLDNHTATLQIGSDQDSFEYLKAPYTGNLKLENTLEIITHVSIHPTQFHTQLNVEAEAHLNQHVIVRLVNDHGKLTRMFGWYLLKGINVTSITQLNNLDKGPYNLQILNKEGELIFTQAVSKA